MFRDLRHRLVLFGLAVGLIVGAGGAAAIAAAIWPARVRPSPSLGSVVVDRPAVRTGPFLVEVGELRCGLAEIVGTHAEFYPKQGQFCRVRVAVTADEAAEDTWDSQLQHLATSSGDSLAVSPDAMHVKRQPLQISLGGYATLDFDLWFDVPQAASPTALLVQGAASSAPVAIPLPPHSWPFGAVG